MLVGRIREEYDNISSGEFWKPTPWNKKRWKGKKKKRKEFFRRTRKFLETKPYSRNFCTNKVSRVVVSKSKVGDLSRGRPEGSLFYSYYTEVYGRALLLSLDCSTLFLIRTIYCWLLSKEVSRNHFWNLWYDVTWDWTQVSRTIGEHSTH